MKLSVPTAIAERAITPDAPGIALWADREATPVLNQVRSFANQVTRERADYNSPAAAGFSIVWESDEMPTDGTWTLFVRLTAGGAQYSSTGLVATLRSVGGAVSLITSTTLWSHLGGATAVQLVVDAAARTAQLSFDDGGAGVLRVVAVIETMEALVE